MERTRLKLAVIFLLAALNVVLLGYVLLQAQQSRAYEDLTRRQAMTYLETHGVLLSESIIPWETDTTKIDLDTERTDDFGGDPIPAEDRHVAPGSGAGPVRLERIGHGGAGHPDGLPLRRRGGPGRSHPHVETGNFWTELLPELRDGGSDPPHRVRRNLL